MPATSETGQRCKGVDTRAACDVQTFKGMLVPVHQRAFFVWAAPSSLFSIMANELTLTGNIHFSKSGIEDQLGRLSIRADVSGSRVVHRTMTVTTTPAALHIGDVTNFGWRILVNRSTDTDIRVRLGAGSPHATIKPGMFAMYYGYPTTGNEYVDVAAGTATLEYLMVEV